MAKHETTGLPTFQTLAAAPGNMANIGGGKTATAPARVSFMLAVPRFQAAWHDVHGVRRSVIVRIQKKFGYAQFRILFPDSM